MNSCPPYVDGARRHRRGRGCRARRPARRAWGHARPRWPLLALAARPRDPVVDRVVAGRRGARSRIATVRAAGWIVWPSLVAAVALGSLAAAGGAAWWPVAAGIGRVTRLDRGLELVARSRRRPTARGGRRWRRRHQRRAARRLRAAVRHRRRRLRAHPGCELVPDYAVDHPAGRGATWVGVAAPAARCCGPAPPSGRARARRHPAARARPSRSCRCRAVALFAAFVGSSSPRCTPARLRAAHRRPHLRRVRARRLRAAARRRVADARGDRGRLAGRVSRVLLGALCLLTLVVLASALTGSSSTWTPTASRGCGSRRRGDPVARRRVRAAPARGRRPPRGLAPAGDRRALGVALLAFATSNPDRRIADAT